MARSAARILYNDFDCEICDERDSITKVEHSSKCHDTRHQLFYDTVTTAKIWIS